MSDFDTSYEIWKHSAKRLQTGKRPEASILQNGGSSRWMISNKQARICNSSVAIMKKSFGRSLVRFHIGGKPLQSQVCRRKTQIK